MALGRKTGGRQKGTPNKLSRELFAKLEELGRDPLLDLHKIMRDKDCSLELRAKIGCELLQYLYPKRKSVEHFGILGGGPSREQFREALLAAAKDLPDELRHMLAAKLLEIDKPNGPVQ